ncbi:MAG: PEGA domain-containing protein [Sedimentisphaerales bacterium]|nr:PEGA domain-containing protein [Sedimentisphaerales bacterium]
MAKGYLPLIGCFVLVILLLGGCVERQLAVKTIPDGALVTLNDEEIGPSPVTTSFNWYGDYNVRISKDGYETLKTHRRLERPTHDKFPWDFVAQFLNPKRIVDKYEWTFELKEKQQLDTEALIDSAKKLRESL